MFGLLFGIVAQAQKVNKLKFEYHYVDTNECKLVDIMLTNVEFKNMFSIFLIKSYSKTSYIQIREMRSNVLLGTFMGNPDAKVIVDVCRQRLSPEYVKKVVPKMLKVNPDCVK